jgi:hypothetical protein
MARHDHASVTVELAEQTLTLQPTPNALIEIDRRFGSVTQALEAMSNPSLENVTFIIAVGAGVGQKDRKALSEEVFWTGLRHLSAPVVNYLIALLDPTGKEAEEGEGEGKA